LLENNLGFFANSKNANALKEEYEQKIQKAKEEIAKIKSKMNDLRNI
jgi:F0F1-type ATP synthase membrane subunit b/b'